MHYAVCVAFQLRFFTAAAFLVLIVLTFSFLCSFLLHADLCCSLASLSRCITCFNCAAIKSFRLLFGLTFVFSPFVCFDFFPFVWFDLFAFVLRTHLVLLSIL